MSQRQADNFVQGLRRLAAGEADALTDAQLIRRFAADRDPGAFSVLVQRHARLVQGVCRNVLRHEQDAEDAAQATFLVLARRASAIREGEAVGGWLYRVAYRVAMKSRQAAERRKKREAKAARPDRVPNTSDLAWRDLQAMLDQELNRLPHRLRTPFVLCVLAGKTKAEAAAELRWKEGTVSSRLAHARERLRTRLARRGVTLSAILSGLAVAEVVPVTAVSPDLVVAAQAFATGERVAGVPAALAREFLRSAAAVRIQLVSALIVLIGIGGTLAGTAFRPSSPSPPSDPAGKAETVVVGPPPPIPDRKTEPGASGPTTMVSGSVQGPDRRPFAGAKVAVIASRLRSGEYDPGAVHNEVLGTGETDAGGRYRVNVPQVSGEFVRMYTFLTAPGHSLVSVAHDPSSRRRESHENRASTLSPVKPVQCRVVDQTGTPASRATLHVLGLSSVTAGYFLTLQPPVEIPGWPGVVVTEEDGSFTLWGVPAGAEVTLQVRDPRFATEWLRFTAAREGAPIPEVRVSPPRILMGQVTTEDTGEPVAGATLVISGRSVGPYYLGGDVTARTDEAGRYAVQPLLSEEYTITVYPPGGTPYPAQRVVAKRPPKADKIAADVALPRGVLVRGKVVEDGSNAPVQGASITYEWFSSHNPYRKPSERIGTAFQYQRIPTGPDGSFTVALPPGPGHLLVKGPTPDYLHTEITMGELHGDQRSGAPYYPDAAVRLDLEPGTDKRDLTVRLRRGVTVRGKVVGSDRKPVEEGLIVSRTYVPYGFELKANPIPVRNGSFEIPGCPPGQTIPVWVHDYAGRSAATADLKVGGPEAEIRLKPCVSARVRVVDEDGKQVPSPAGMLMLEVRAGAEGGGALMEGRVAAEHLYTGHLYPRNYVGEPHGPTSKAGGVLHVSDLIPGAVYQLHVQQQLGTLPAVRFVAPDVGELDLKSVVIKPRTKK